VAAGPEDDKKKEPKKKLASPVKRALLADETRLYNRARKSACATRIKKVGCKALERKCPAAVEAALQERQTHLTTTNSLTNGLTVAADVQAGLSFKLSRYLSCCMLAGYQDGREDDDCSSKERGRGEGPRDSHF
jgi:ribosomal protein S20